MIKDFVKTLVIQISQRDDIIFITGDVGYRSLDPIKELLGDKFINAGVAEQNMINVAAGMAAEGYKVYVYTIAPFLIYRAYEQIKLNVAGRNLDVNLIANGGGYGYGVMGPTHHALNDLALLNGLENLKGYIPSCSLDVEECVKLSLKEGPKYFRLGLNNQSIPKRFENGFGICETSGDTTVVSLGPLAQAFESENVDQFTCFEFPFQKVPESLISSIRKNRKLIIAEEHTKDGGVGEKLLALLQNENIDFEFTHRFANQYEGGYGDQEFHRKNSGIDAESLKQLI